jgi:hypothetical protein
MPRFNLEDYETVEERHARAIAQYPDLRCVIINHTTPTDRAAATWVVEARVYLNAGDQAADLPKATEWAFEVDGTGGANATSALENANTSALGRALRWALAGSKGPSRTEMQKVQAGVVYSIDIPPGTKLREPRDWVAEAEALTDMDALRLLWGEAKAAGANAETLDKVKTRADSLEDAKSQPAGAARSVRPSGKKK